MTRLTAFLRRRVVVFFVGGFRALRGECPGCGTRASGLTGVTDEKRMTVWCVECHLEWSGTR